MFIRQSQRAMQWFKKTFVLPNFKWTGIVIFRRRLHQLIGRNGCCAASS
ncbi:Tn21 protein of unknown function Urf2 (plasmid) [Pseudomonas putida]|nr:Tn21 protein of unknown function Urf2 [Pseudomonas putida]